MTFTPLEHKMVERLRRQEQFWPRARWILLVWGILGSAAMYGMMIAMNAAAKSALIHDTGFEAVFWSGCFFAFVGHASFVLWAIRDWRGNTTRRLLLKLIDAAQERDRKI